MNDLEALDDLARHPGWILVLQMIDDEWGAAGFGAKLARTLGSWDLPPEVKVSQLEQATVAQKAVLAVRDWPKERIQQLRREALQSLSPGGRRGPGL